MRLAFSSSSPQMRQGAGKITDASAPASSRTRVVERAPDLLHIADRLVQEPLNRLSTFVPGERRAKA